MRFAISDKQPPFGIHKHTVRPIHFAQKRVRFGSISALSRAEYRAYDSRIEINPSNDMVLSICHIKLPLAVRQPFRSRKGRLHRCRTVT